MMVERNAWCSTVSVTLVGLCRLMKLVLVILISSLLMMMMNLVLILVELDDKCAEFLSLVSLLLFAAMVPCSRASLVDKI